MLSAVPVVDERVCARARVCANSFGREVICFSLFFVFFFTGGGGGRWIRISRVEKPAGLNVFLG